MVIFQFTQRYLKPEGDWVFSASNCQQDPWGLDLFLWLPSQFSAPGPAPGLGPVQISMFQGWIHRLEVILEDKEDQPTVLRVSGGHPSAATNKIHIRCIRCILTGTSLVLNFYETGGTMSYVLDIPLTRLVNMAVPQGFADVWTWAMSEANRNTQAAPR